MKPCIWLLLAVVIISGYLWLQPGERGITEPPIPPAKVSDFGDVRLRSLGGKTVDEYCDSLADAQMGMPRQP